MTGRVLRRASSMAIAVGCVSGTLTIGTQAAHAATVAGAFALALALKGYCLDVSGKEHEEHAWVRFEKCNGTDLQKWAYDPEKKTLQAPSGCLDILDFQFKAGTRVVTYSGCHGLSNEQWQFDEKTGGLQSVAAPHLCLGAADGQIRSGANVVLVECTGGPDQSWRQIPEEEAQDGSPVIDGPADGVTTQDDTPEIYGMGKPGTDVTVRDSHGHFVCKAKVSPAGMWRCAPYLPLDHGWHTFHVVDSDGNVSAAISFYVAAYPPPGAAVIHTGFGGMAVPVSGHHPR